MKFISIVLINKININKKNKFDDNKSILSLNSSEIHTLMGYSKC
jgi:hypothetical protein